MTEPASKRAALLVATLAAFLTPFMGSAVNIALPAIGQEFAMDAILLGWVATAYLLSAAMFLVPCGRLADIYGRKRLFTAGILIYTLSSLLLALSPSSLALIAFRILQGAGSAMIFGTGVAILTSVYPAGERGRVLGFNVAAVYLGLSVGPFLGGFLTQRWGWRSVFLINVPLGALIVLCTLWQLKGEWAGARGERFDLAGSVLYALALSALMYGFSLLPSPVGAWVVLLGVLGGTAFVRWESRAQSPVLDIGLFRGNPAFAFSNLAALINYSATAAVGFLLSLYLQYVKGLSPQDAGLILVSQPLVQALFSPLAGRLSDRLEPRLVASAGMALNALGLAFLVFLHAGTALAPLIANLALLGFGFALFSSPNTNAVMSAVERRAYGVASATLGTMRLTGQMLSLGIVMLIFAVSMGRTQITPTLYPLFLRSARAAFLIFAVLCLGGIFASLARGNIHHNG